MCIVVVTRNSTIVDKSSDTFVQYAIASLP